MSDTRQEMESLFTDNLIRNLELFRSYSPDIYELFKDYKEKRYFLVYDSFGNYNVFDTESSNNVFSGNPKESARKSYSEYVEDPIYYSTYYGRNVGLHAEVNPVHSKTSNDLGYVIFEQKTTQKRSDKLPERIKTLIITSVGLGFDLELLYDNHSIQYCCIADVNPDLFFASLHVIRWDLIFKKADENNQVISIKIDEDPDALSKFLDDQVGRYGRHNANSLYVYSSFHNKEEEKLLKHVNELIRSKFLKGFGFYDDGRMSIAATVENVRSKIPLMTNKLQCPAPDNSNVPVFIIGAGPSLDEDLQYIEKFQDKALIVSCGSGIKSLHRYGIKPDLHLECERTAFTKHWLDQVDSEYLSKIDFIGLNVLYPDVFSMFNRTAMMVKSNEPGSMALATAISKVSDKKVPFISHVNPTVVHMGVGALPILGFRKFYLFGVDMGYKDPNKHHSSLSSYSDLKDEEKKKFVPSENGIYEVESNFSDQKIYSDDSYGSFKKFLEGMIEANLYFSEYECFNCSDGALIKGAKPMRSADLIFDDKPVEKKQIVDDTFDAFFDHGDFLGLEQEIVSVVNDFDIEKFCLAASEHFSVSVNSQLEGDFLIDGFIKRFFLEKDFVGDDHSHILGLFSGSMLYYFTMLNRLLYYRGENIDSNVYFFNKGIRVVSEFFDRVSEEYRNGIFLNDDVSRYDLF